jgi:cis-L-3-hydroxyproline dehydratase
MGSTAEPSAQDGFVLRGTAYVHGKTSGKLVTSDLELSFWGGVNPQTGEIIDRHHTLSGTFLQGTILVIPGGRGSCSGSGVMLELLLNGKGPEAVIFQRREDILTLGVIISEDIFGRAIPVLTLDTDGFQAILKRHGQHVHIDGDRVSAAELPGPGPGPDASAMAAQPPPVARDVELSAADGAFLDGSGGKAAQVSMRIILRMAALLGAHRLLDVTQVHVDGCIYTGPGSLAFAQRLRDWGGKVAVPTTLNSVSIDQKRWRAQGVDPVFGEASRELAAAYTDMGARPTFTCAPYQLDTAPGLGDQVAWAESNAVVYANSVLGARTIKYPDFLDIAIALTGRAPEAGPHQDANRLASVCITVTDARAFRTIDDSFYPLLGYKVGSLAPTRIPVVAGLEALAPSRDDLKAFGAAFATASSMPMLHILGVTPEAASLDAVLAKESPVIYISLDTSQLSPYWDKLNSADPGQRVDLISLGNPHFSFAEIKKLAALCRDKKKHAEVTVVVTCGRATHALAGQAGLVEALETFGVRFLNDTCWCMITEPVIPRAAKAIMTNSGKYAHYGPGLTGRRFFFGGLASCVEAACSGVFRGEKPQWLVGE